MTPELRTWLEVDDWVFLDHEAPTAEEDALDEDAGLPTMPDAEFAHVGRVERIEGDVVYVDLGDYSDGYRPARLRRIDLTTPGGLLAFADHYGVDGESGTDWGHAEVDALIVALCRLAKLHREATL